MDNIRKYNTCATYKRIVQYFQTLAQSSPNWDNIPYLHRNKLDMILHEIAWVLNEEHDYDCHYENIIEHSQSILDSMRKGY